MWHLKSWKALSTNGRMNTFLGYTMCSCKLSKQW
jgi:hypothetical protein